MPTYSMSLFWRDEIIMCVCLFNYEDVLLTKISVKLLDFNSFVSVCFTI